MSPLTNTTITQTTQPRTRLIIITFIFLFTFIFFLNYPLKSDPFHSSSTWSTLTSHLYSLANFYSLTNTSSTRNGSGYGSSLMGPSTCDMFDGSWVYDDSDPIYAPGSCPFVGNSFNCFKIGRPDSGYLKYRWQPYACDIPRFDGKKMMEILKGKRMVFIGDSLNRNMWESLVCSLSAFKIYGTNSSQPHTTTFQIKDYNCSIILIRAAFLVQQLKEIPRSSDKEVKKLQLDTIHYLISENFDADYLIFNTGHWWNHNKTQNGANFFQVGDVLHKKMEVEEAYKIALNTWAQWVDKNVNKKKTRVFFVGYSAAHYKGGEWYSGGDCIKETEPIKEEKLLEQSYPWTMTILETVISKMSTPVTYLNITKLTEYRKDGHPSMYGRSNSILNSKAVRDCSHWCLPGIPESWNQLLYTHLLLSSNSTNSVYPLNNLG